MEMYGMADIEMAKAQVKEMYEFLFEMDMGLHVTLDKARSVAARKCALSKTRGLQTVSKGKSSDYWRGVSDIIELELQIGV